MKDSLTLYQTIKDAVDQVRIVDTHEHLIPEKERVSQKVDVFEVILSHYASSDLVSSGMALEDLDTIRDRKISLTERWNLFQPYWELIQNTGYARALNIAIRELYEVNSISEDTYQNLALRMEDKNKPGLYHWVLKERSGISVSIWDGISTPLSEVDRDFFAPVMRFDDFVTVKERRDIEALEKECGMYIHSFADYIQAFETRFDRLSNLIVGVKIGLAYNRSLRFDKVSQREAEEVFTNIYSQETFKRIHVPNRTAPLRVPEGLSSRETKPFENFMVHKIIQAAARKKLPIQIHTGIQEGNENILTNSRPTHLINLFREYKEAKFDIFHGSYPYTGELAALAKNFPNVYIDMCWLHIISPYRARQALAEWLDTVPWNKIFGFGGDYLFVEGVYGHAVIARENITQVLTEKVEEHSLTLKQAITLAHKLLRDNPHSIFF
jgi:hypothetical protein